MWKKLINNFFIIFCYFWIYKNVFGKIWVYLYIFNIGRVVVGIGVVVVVVVVVWWVVVVVVLVCVIWCVGCVVMVVILCG